MTNLIINITERTLQSFIEKIKPPKEIRGRMDIGFTYEKDRIEIFEIAPIWGLENKFSNYPYARIKYVKTQKKWKLFWMNLAGEWESYQSFPESSYLDELLAIIDEDALGCFLG